MPGGVLLQELLPEACCACPLLSSHSACIVLFFPSSSFVMHQNISPHSPFPLSLTLVFPAYISLSLVYSKPLLHPTPPPPSLLLTLFSYPLLIFSLLALPSPLRHQLYTHRLCFHGVSHRFWQSALETQDHFK